METSVSSVFVQKLPAWKGQPARLGVLINPVNTMGSPTKKRGILIRDVEEYKAFQKIFRSDGIVKLLDMISPVNPETGKRSSAKGVIKIG